MTERFSIPIKENEEPLQEKCGIVALFSPRPISLFPDALTAATGVQHRGQHGAGVVSYTEQGLVHHKESGFLYNVFSTEKIKYHKLCAPSLWTIIHCRYGTSGSWNENNIQPLIAGSDENDPVVVAHNGQLVVLDELRARCATIPPEGASDTYVFAQLLAAAQGKNWEEKIVKTLSSLKGAYSFVIGAGHSLFAARDPDGIRPLVLGKKDDVWIVASETHALEKIGAIFAREIQRGEILRLNKQGLTVLREGLSGKGHFCDFEFAYFSHPASHQEGNYIASFRERCGEILAKEYPLPHADFVVGVPDSGIFVATGYARKSGLPYRQVIIRDHFDVNGIKRLFMCDDQIQILPQQVIGKLTLIPDKQIWNDATIVIADDSIVRGTVSKKLTQAIFDLGAKEVHWIVGFPPVAFECHLGVSLRDKKELIAHRNACNIERIADEIGATSVYYISNKGFIGARMQTTRLNTPSNPGHLFLENCGCGGCITGIYPVDKEGVIFDAQDNRL